MVQLQKLANSMLFGDFIVEFIFLIFYKLFKQK